jgi:CDP-diacylglycerol--serine O-phosphatidyltransferase
LPIPGAAALIAALIHFAPQPLIGYAPERARVYSTLLMVLVGVLSVMMVSTLRFSSFKTVGSGSRSMRTIIIVLAIGGLIVLYSQYVLLALVLSYILHGALESIQRTLASRRIR